MCIVYGIKAINTLNDKFKLALKLNWKWLCEYSSISIKVTEAICHFKWESIDSKYCSLYTIHYTRSNQFFIIRILGINKPLFSRIEFSLISLECDCYFLHGVQVAFHFIHVVNHNDDPCTENGKTFIKTIDNVLFFTIQRRNIRNSIKPNLNAGQSYTTIGCAVRHDFMI